MLWGYGGLLVKGWARNLLVRSPAEVTPLDKKTAKEPIKNIGSKIVKALSRFFFLELK
ncbi:MAG: hypothetical protein ABIH67_04845 [Candidatus Uhrbacteria bacterium]